MKIKMKKTWTLFRLNVFKLKSNTGKQTGNLQSRRKIMESRHQIMGLSLGNTKNYN